MIRVSEKKSVNAVYNGTLGLIVLFGLACIIEADPDRPDIDVERQYDLDVCDVWKAAGSGGHEGTLDEWDISHIPRGAEIDFRFDAYTIPDRFEVEYPVGVTVVDTGWRGASSYDGDPDYPGGVTAPGYDMMEGIFIKDSSDRFVVMAFGVDEDTAWEYSVRCRN